MFPVEEITIAQLHAGYLEGKTTAREVTEAYLERIAAYDKRGPYLNALITVNPNAVADAANLDAALKSNGKLTGPLHGIPIIVKDNIDTSDMPTSSGVALFKDFIPTRDAFIVQRLHVAGAIILAKSSLSELAMGLADTINSVLPGFTRNPYNTAYASGGSRRGAGGPRAAKLGTARHGPDPRVVELFETAIADLRRAGAEIVDDFTVPGLEKFPRPPQTAAHYKADWERFFAYEGPRFPVKTVAELRDAPAGKSVHALHAARVAEVAAVTKTPDEDPSTVQGRKDEQMYREAFSAAMDAARVDAVVFPVWTFPPKINGDRGQTPQGQLTFIGSATQWPVVVVPMGFVGENLPMGFQFLGRLWSEGPLIRFAYAYEQLTRHRRPAPTGTPILDKQ